MTPLQETVREAFAPGGVLSRAADHFMPRSGQTDMAMAVARVIEQGGPLVVEAGTGVGKTFSYLVPALLSGERVLLSGTDVDVVAEFLPALALGETTAALAVTEVSPPSAIAARVACTSASRVDGLLGGGPGGVETARLTGKVTPASYIRMNLATS